MEDWKDRLKLKRASKRKLFSLTFCRSFCRRPGCRHRNSCCPNCPVLCGGLRRTVSPQMLVKSLDKLCDVQDFIARSGYK